jgi:uncharacterized membrane protein YheB (UPF0754 family)
MRINNIELPNLSVTDYETTVRLEKANDELQKEVATINSSTYTKESEGIKMLCAVFDKFFDAAFGAGTAIKLFGSTLDYMQRISAAKEFFEERKRISKKNIEEIKQVANNFAGTQNYNREQRRNFNKHNNNKKKK